ncbi:MAG: VWA domain-containing protein [Chloroflexota bacterium]|nr:MAG: VWA domain-containing protein [Chloroflexota bacterium]
MFVDFFYMLKKHKVPVSLVEWMTLMEALSKGYAFSSLTDFYYLARSILIKSETQFDRFDVAFRECFEGIETPAELADEVLDWLDKLAELPELSPEEYARLPELSLEELLKTLEERLREQREEHHGGSKWIGTGGTSPFGHSGRSKAGIRIGGQGGSRSAVQIAAKRDFAAYRQDLVLDVRQMQVALRKLRQLTRTGPEDQLDLEKTIDKTCKNAGELDFVWTAERKNNVKLLLLMDVGGSMTPHAQLCSRLFSAANSARHFKDFRFYYFHNCVYESVWPDVGLNKEDISTDYLLRTLTPDYKVILVGDATMYHGELLEKNGAIDYYQHNDTPGIVWLQRIHDHFTHCVWLNPQHERDWHHPTVQLVRRVFPMFGLTLEGLDAAIKRLVVSR